MILAMQRHKCLLSLIVWLRSNPILVQRPMSHSRTYAEDSFESRVSGMVFHGFC